MVVCYCSCCNSEDSNFGDHSLVFVIVLYKKVGVSIVYILLFLFVLVCCGESITVWLFLGYVTRHLMRVG